MVSVRVCGSAVGAASAPGVPTEIGAQPQSHTSQPPERGGGVRQEDGNVHVSTATAGNLSYRLSNQTLQVTTCASATTTMAGASPCPTETGRPWEFATA